MVKSNRIVSRSCSGSLSQENCPKAGYRAPTWYSGNFNAGLPDLDGLNFGECVRLGWERLLDGSFRLRAEYRPGCVDKLLNDNTRLRYDQDFHRGQCPASSPTSDEIYRCVDRFGTALLKVGVLDLYYLGYDERCQGPFQSVVDYPCPLNQWGVVQSTWGEIPSEYGSIDNCGDNLYGNNICGNIWTIESETVQPGALINDQNIAPQGPCVGLEPNVVLIRYESPTSCGGFIPCGRVITYRCDKTNCYILTEDLDRITTEDGDLLLWCNETNDSVDLQVGAVPLTVGSAPGVITLEGDEPEPEPITIASTTYGASPGTVSLSAAEITLSSMTVGSTPGSISVIIPITTASIIIGSEPGAIT